MIISPYYIKNKSVRINVFIYPKNIKITPLTYKKLKIKEKHKIISMTVNNIQLKNSMSKSLPKTSQSASSVRGVECCNLQVLKDCKDNEESLSTPDSRGRTLLWKLTRSFNTKTDIDRFNG